LFLSAGTHAPATECISRQIWLTDRRSFQQRHFDIWTVLSASVPTVEVLKIAMISFVAVVVSLAGWGIWKDVLRTQRRKQALRIAARKLPRSEQIDWFNRVGRYKEPGAIPRTLDLQHMTPEEVSRFINRTGEFADGSDVDGLDTSGLN
jgi:hypothetical protein